ncbi:MAG: 5'-nucleotidase domain-containing protein, partial [Myxococcota bacterium]
MSVPLAPPVEAVASIAAAPPPGRRVFVNRNLRFEEIEWIGFDMDYTLARYAKRELERLSFDLTKQRLVEHLGYPETILAVPYDADFVTRGLAVDTRFGNILKVDRHGYVGRAYRGRRRLDRAERHERYRNVKVRLHAKRYHWIDTLFALPEVSLFASLVDFFDDVGGGPPYEKMFADVRESIDTCHRD